MNEKSEEKITNKETKQKKTEKSIIEELNKEIAQLKEKNEVLKKEKLLLLANNENTRKRYLEDTQEFQKYANKKLLKKFLPFINNYEQALTFGQQVKDPKINSFLSGFKIMNDELKKILKSEGIKEIPIAAEKDLLDSRLHEALEELATDKFPPETILEILQKGYLLNDQVLTTTKVKISKPLEKKQNNKNK